MVNSPVMNNEARAFLFDYGGTLDTGGRHWGKVLWAAWQQSGVPVDETRFREAYVYAERTMDREAVIQPGDTFRQTLETKLQLELDYVGQPDHLQRVLDIVYRQTLRHTDHSREVLRQLAERCPLVLVSNFYGNIRTVLQEFDLDGLFLQVIESAVVGIRKPDPRIFLLGVEALGLRASEVAVVGDSMANDILPARQAGCKTIWLRGEQWENSMVDETIPNRIISDLTELL